MISLRKKLSLMVVMAAIVALGLAVPAQAKKMVPKVDNFIMFIDHSSSMGTSYKSQKYVQFGGVSKIAIAKDDALAMTKAIPELGYKSGVYTFAPYKEYAGMAPFTQAGTEKAIKPIATEYELYGRLTNLGDGLASLDKVLGTLSGKTAVIIFSDGDNNLGLDPVAQAKALQAKYGDKLCFHIVSFADTKNGERILKEIAALSKCTCMVLGEDLKIKENLDRFIQCALYDFIEDEIVIFRSIYFDFNKYNIKKEFIPVLDEGVSIVKSKPGTLVILEGHTDSVGSVKYNQGLSERRANSVKQYFVKKGVDASMIQAIGYGKLHPRYDNKTAEGRKMNRRVEIKFKHQ